MYAVILAGGSGTRLWPLARAAQPKQFLPLFGRRSLFSLTCQRIAPLIPASRTLVVASARHARWVREQAPRLPSANLILEGLGRNTAAAIALAALWIRSRSGDGVMVVLPADHWIEPASKLRSAIRRAIAAVRGTNGLATIGVTPRGPETGFGYIRPIRGDAGGGLARIAGFVEKPDLARARRMVASGRYLWNSGIFVWGSGAIIQELRRHRPDVLRPLGRWAESAPTQSWSVPSSVLLRIPAVPIDRAVLERSENVRVARGWFSWSDLGTWSALGERLARDGNGNARDGRLCAFDSRECIAYNPDGLSVLVGVRDLVVARSGDALLVCHRGAVQTLREIPGLLRGPLRRFL